MSISRIRGQVKPDLAQGDEDPGDLFPVHRRRPPEAVEHLLPADAADELQRLPVRQRGNGEDRVFEELGHHPAQTEHDAGTELGIAQEPEDQLHLSRDAASG